MTLLADPHRSGHPFLAPGALLRRRNLRRLLYSLARDGRLRGLLPTALQQCKRSAIHVIDESDTFEWSPDPWEVCQCPTSSPFPHCPVALAGILAWGKAEKGSGIRPS